MGGPGVDGGGSAGGWVTNKRYVSFIRDNGRPRPAAYKPYLLRIAAVRASASLS